ncbi:10358_t:CDS:1, partial [Paraglomus occultum]
MSLVPPSTNISEVRFLLLLSIPVVLVIVVSSGVFFDFFTSGAR